MQMSLNNNISITRIKAMKHKKKKKERNPGKSNKQERDYKSQV